MGLPELFLEHKRAGKAARHHRVTAKSKIFVIGSSADADLRIGGDDVLGCHAVLQYQAPHWYLRSLAVDGSPVKMNDQPVVEAIVDGKASFEIGAHRIELFSKERTDNLFTAVKVQQGELTLHQIVVSMAGKVLRTHIRGATEGFNLYDGDRVIALEPPTTAQWKETTVGKKVVRQRLVSEQDIIEGGTLDFDQDLRRPVGAAIGIMLLLLCLTWLMPKPKPNEMVLDQKSIDMIFNADAIKKKRIEAKKVVSAKARSGGVSTGQAPSNIASMPDQSMAPTKSEKATAALNSIRNSGLSNLIGKIAKRANKNGILLAAQGVSPDNKNSGRGYFSNGKSTVGGGGAAAVAGNTYRLGGVATKGKGGGVSGVRDGTALAGGNVGTGDVAMVDEETVIEGGLDRDVIADVIRRNLGQIRYCYERQLSSNPDLYGKLLVKFTIDAAGGVLEPKIDTSTMKSSMVEGCVLRRMAGWKFPLPKGGTQVRVTYPFLFKALD